MFAAATVCVRGFAIGASAPMEGANRAQSVLEPPLIKHILNGNSGQILARVGPVKNAKADEVRYALAPAGQPQGPSQSGGLFTNSHSMPINALTPGQNYMFQVRAIGGSTGIATGAIRWGI
jgi:hypothetical protein